MYTNKFSSFTRQGRRSAKFTTESNKTISNSNNSFTPERSGYNTNNSNHVHHHTPTEQSNGQLKSLSTGRRQLSVRSRSPFSTKDIESKLQNIIKLIQLEKQKIINHIKEQQEQMNEYKARYQALKDQKELQKQRPERGQQVAQTYQKLIQLLQNLNVDQKQVLPQMYDDQESSISIQVLNKDEVIEVQRLIIQKLAKKTQVQQQMHKLLQNRINQK